MVRGGPPPIARTQRSPLGQSASLVQSIWQCRGAVALAGSRSRPVVRVLRRRTEQLG